VTTDRSDARSDAHGDAHGDRRREALERARTGDGTTLARLSERGPLLLLFLRHFG
jgi:hypothetical protein